MDITGTAFITGGASGIGKACCFAFAKEGASGVVVADINLEAAEKTAQEIKAVASHPKFEARAIHIDVSDLESVKSAIAKTAEAFGRIDYSVHSAGVPGGTFDAVAEANVADFKRLVDVNINGTFFVTSIMSATMKAQDAVPVSESEPERGLTRGCMVNMASISSYISVPSMVQYTTSKHAVLGITRTAAIDNVAHHIRVNCVCPSWTDTPMVQTAMEVVPGLEASLLSGIPMGRLGRPSEVADTALYLCSSRSSFTTGTGVIMDGGMSIGAKT
jgi:NAD(P)-dependent dehydrogenase (short-subunit alcohol dehydrogenase family)